MGSQTSYADTIREGRGFLDATDAVHALYTYGGARSSPQVGLCFEAMASGGYDFSMSFLNYFSKSEIAIGARAEPILRWWELRSNSGFRAAMGASIPDTWRTVEGVFSNVVDFDLPFGLLN
ncbi:unnamed protein product, partial [Symbiodinium sp. KB8]